MSGHPQGACCANAYDGKKNGNQRFIFFIHCFLLRSRGGPSITFRRDRIMLLQPKLHQLNLRFLVCDNFLRRPADLWVFAIHQLGLGHVDYRLVMESINLTKSTSLSPDRSTEHGDMHFLHAPHQLKPVDAHARLGALRVRILRQLRNCIG
jgi:hypothetical protein